MYIYGNYGVFLLENWIHFCTFNDNIIFNFSLSITQPLLDLKSQTKSKFNNIKKICHANCFT